ncbi:MAG TPA: glycosyltransferase family 4 protein [Gemmatimonadales bacterium]|nr:glycosyltransferase family 4 protein [Gemmatimonadales bacterium]
MPALAPRAPGTGQGARRAARERAHHRLGAARLKYLLYTETYPSLDPASPRQTGIGRYCHDLADGLVQLGARVTVLTNTEVGAQGRFDRGGIAVVAERTAAAGRLGLIARAAGMRSLIRAEAPDILLVGDQLAHQVCSLLGRLPAPYAPIFYGSELLAMRGALDAGGSAQRLARTLRRRYVRRARFTVCISRFTEGLLRALQADAPATQIVFPCVSRQVLEQPVRPGATARLRARLGWPADSAPVALTVARISERKNQLGVLRALALLRRQGAPPIRYVVMGNVDAARHESYQAELRAFIGSNGLDGLVGWIARASDEEKVDALDGCDLSVMLSQAAGDSVEGFGISVAEASARGRPVVVSDQGGMPETIIEGQTGYAVSPTDPLAAAGAIGRLAADAGLRERMGAAGRAFVQAELTPRVMAERLRRAVESAGISRSGR